MKIPKEIDSIIKKLNQKKFEAYVVGGCVRDILMGLEPKDWDIATNARPEEIQKVFPKSFYKNQFFTVTVQTGNKNEILKEVEITTYRKEATYTDRRHPDQVKFSKSIEEDLARRDFTVNAIAIGLKEKNKKQFKKTVDPFGGRTDLEKKIIKAVGKSEDRFSEDALRMLRAVRFAVSLGKGWEIEKNTAKAIENNSVWIQAISKERVRDEFIKIINSDGAAEGMELMRKLKLLKYVLPELQLCYGVEQNKHHIYDCYEHCLRALAFAAKKKFNTNVRIASLFHDIGKPKTKRGEGKDSTFYGHEIVGAKMALQILERLKFPKKDIEKIAKLVRYHLFYYNPDEVGESSVRRLVREVGPENMAELLQVRMADRIGSGVPKAEPYKLRHLKYIIEKVSQDPISPKMLKLNGDAVMKILDIESGPKVGQILDILLGYVLKEPKDNKKTFLEAEAKKLGKLSEKDLLALSKKAKTERAEIEIKRDQMTRQKYWVS